MKEHYSTISIDKYRGIDSLKIKDLGSVNIIVGDNNVGKTSVLEAIQILSDSSKYNILQVARQREKYKFASNMGLSSLDLFLYLFSIGSDSEYSLEVSGVLRDCTTSVKIEGEVVEQLIEGSSSAGEHTRREGTLVEGQKEIRSFIGSIESKGLYQGQVSLTDLLDEGDKLENIEVSEYTKVTKTSKDKPQIPAILVQSIDHLVSNIFSEIIKDKEVKTRAVELLKHFDSNIVDLRYINDNGRFIPVVESNHRDYIPLSMYGDGMKKVLTIINALIVAKDGVALIDEFETAVHTSVMKKVFEFMMTSAKQLNVQLFLTTHSIEALDKLLESSGDDIDSVRVITLKRDKDSGVVKARSLVGTEVLEDRKNFDFEVRQ